MVAMIPPDAQRLFTSHGYSLLEIYLQVTYPCYAPWGYLVHCPDATFAIFTDKLDALQYLNRAMYPNSPVENEVPEVHLSSLEVILQEDITSAPSTSCLITVN